MRSSTALLLFTAINFPNMFYNSISKKMFPKILGSLQLVSERSVRIPLDRGKTLSLHRILRIITYDMIILCALEHRLSWVASFESCPIPTHSCVIRFLWMNWETSVDFFLEANIGL